MGYTFTKGTTAIEFFDGDMHTFSIRADKVLTSWADMKEVVDRFEADKSQFDYTDYFTTANFHKASRDYTVLVEKEASFEEIVFEFNGREYRTKTTKWTKVRQIKNNADKILSHEQVFALCLVDDATGAIVGVNGVLRTLDILAGEDCLPF